MSRFTGERGGGEPRGGGGGWNEGGYGQDRERNGPMRGGPLPNRDRNEPPNRGFDRSPPNRNDNRTGFGFGGGSNKYNAGGGGNYDAPPRGFEKRNEPPPPNRGFGGPHRDRDEGRNFNGPMKDDGRGFAPPRSGDDRDKRDYGGRGNDYGPPRNDRRFDDPPRGMGQHRVEPPSPGRGFEGGFRDRGEGGRGFNGPPRNNDEGRGFNGPSRKNDDDRGFGGAPRGRDENRGFDRYDTRDRRDGGYADGTRGGPKFGERSEFGRPPAELNSSFGRNGDRGEGRPFGGNRQTGFGQRNDDYRDNYRGSNNRFERGPNESRNDGGYRSNNGRFGRMDSDRGGHGFSGNDNSYGFGSGGGQLLVENSRFAAPEKKRAPKDWFPEIEGAEELQKEDKAFLGGLGEVDDTPVELEGGRDLPIFTEWEDSGLQEELLENCRKSGYLRPRLIQSHLIPHILDGSNVIGVTETGSGKTAAFVLPILHKLKSMGKEILNEHRYICKPFAMVIAPTRELAKQIYMEFVKLSKDTGVAVALSYGEMPKFESINKMQREGCHVLVGTAGRLMDFVVKGTITLKMLKFFVIDEADRMLQDIRGSEDHLSAIINDSNFPKATDRQTLLFSATFEKDVESIATTVMGDPTNGRKTLLPYVKAKHSVSTQANKRVVQVFVETDGLPDKHEELFRIMNESMDKENDKVPRTLIFVNQKKRSDTLAQMLCMRPERFRAASINGDRPQNEREKALNDFKDGRVDILVGTDVCSRGLDIHNLDHVINFDLPNSGAIDQLRDTYIHRIGRTGRLRQGKATTFISRRDTNDTNFAKTLVELVEKAGQQAPKFLKELGDGGSTSSYGYQKPGNFSSGSMNKAENSQLTNIFSNTADFASNGFGKSSFGPATNETETVDGGGSEEQKEEEPDPYTAKKNDDDEEW